MDGIDARQPILLPPPQEYLAVFGPLVKEECAAQLLNSGGQDDAEQTMDHACVVSLVERVCRMVVVIFFCVQCMAWWWGSVSSMHGMQHMFVWLMCTLCFSLRICSCARCVFSCTRNHSPSLFSCTEAGKTTRYI